ncbi:MAG: FAD-dependent oxidoreductase [Evtepia sp.]|nr:FAD-dependent oxidoreductase [Evtepia sp.]
MATTTVDIVVYGGGFAGVAAAAKAAANTASNKTIALIVPDPVDHNGNGSCLGGIGTIGGQNYFDIRTDSKGLVTKGTFNWWHTKLGQHYSVDEMAALLKADLAKYGSKIKYYYGYDISSVGWDSRITSLTVKQIKRNPTTGIVEWESVQHTINGTVFIDASESGRLTRRANFGGTTGRFDFPATYLDADEKTNYGKGRQQVATLMFKVTGFDKDYTGDDITILDHADTNHVYSAGGGEKAYQNKKGKIYQFNEKHGPEGFALKPFNMAQDGPNSSEWWVNMLLVFNVDGRAYNRDKGTYLFPSDMRSDYKTVDDAWVEARNIINSAEFLDTIKEFPGFRNVQIVKKNGKPVVGEVMYLRETIHAALSSTNRANGTENTNYGLTTNEANGAGASGSSGGDSQNYATRIGLNFYWSDINAYKFEDIKDANGNYIWFDEVFRKVRPDLGLSASSPAHPVYVPYNAITSNYVANLLTPGYAACMSSFAWAECRVLPNQCVLGDAAGVAAAYAITHNKDPLRLTASDLSQVQATLRNSGARLEK